VLGGFPKTPSASSRDRQISGSLGGMWKIVR
jgi:hypothetical protein